MAIVLENDVSLPDIPEEAYEYGSYAVVIRMNMGNTDVTNLMITSIPFVAGLAADIGMPYDMISPEGGKNADCAIFTIIGEDYSSWGNGSYTRAVDASDLMSPIGTNLSTESYTYSQVILWTNYDIMVCNVDTISATDIVYFANCVAPEYAEKYVVSSSFLVSVADNVRRLKNMNARLSNDQMLAGLESIPRTEGYDWLATLESEYDEDTEEINITSRAERLLRPKPFELWIEGPTNLFLPNAITIDSALFMLNPIKTVSAPMLNAVPSRAFAGCEILETLDLPAATAIGENAFDTCPTLTSVNIPAATDIGADAFRNCTALASVDLPAVTTIGEYAFTGCTSLEMLDFLLDVYLNNYAFEDCENLTALIFRNTETVSWSSVSNTPFAGTPIASGNGYIYVPSALKSEYLKYNFWKNYSDQIRALEDYTVDGTTTGELDESKI